MRGVFHAAFVVLSVGSSVNAQNVSCYISQELNLEGLSGAAIQPDVFFRESDSTNLTSDATDNVATSPFIWSLSPCVPEKFAGKTVVHETVPTTLLGCAVDAYLAIHASDGSCVDTYTEIISGPEELLPAGERGIRTQYRSAVTGQTATVDVMCTNNAGLQSGAAMLTQSDLLQASLAQNATGVVGAVPPAGYSNVTLAFASRRGCRLNPLLCPAANSVFCEDPALVCMGSPGVCVTQNNCLAIEKKENPASVTGVNVRKAVVVRDTCKDIIVPGLTTLDFVLKVDDRVVDNTQPEGAVLVSPNAGSAAQQMVSVALDQSASVIDTKMEYVKTSLAQFLDALFPDPTQSSASPPKVGIFTFDGSDEVIALQPSFSDEKDLLKATVANQLPKSPGDAQSTNLYGALSKVVSVTLSAAESMSYGVTENGVYAEVTPQKSLVVFSDGDDTARRFDKTTSIQLAKNFRLKNNDTTIFYVDVSDDEIDKDYALAVTGDPTRYFKIGLSDLSETFANIGNLLQIQRSTYTINLCTPFRSDVHGLFIQLNTSRYGVGPTNETWFPFGTDNLEPDCTSATLAAAEKADLEEPKVITSTLPVLSPSQVMVTTNGYFLIQPTGLLSAYAYVLPSKETNHNGATSFSVVLNDGGVNCEVVTKYCFAANGSNRATLPSSVFDDLSNPRQAMGLILSATNEPLANDISVYLSTTPIPITQIPTPAPTPGGTVEDTDDDSDFNWWILIAIVAAVVIICWVCFYLARKVNQKNKEQKLAAEQQQQQLEEAQRDPVQNNEVVQERVVTFQHEKLTHESRSAPMNFNSIMHQYSVQDPHTLSPQGSAHSQLPAENDLLYGSEVLVGMSSPNTMNGKQAYHPLKEM